jgi:glutamyl-tRNA reductase
MAPSNRATWLEKQAARRRQVLIDLAQPGATCATVASLHGISKQRVHQIKKKEGGRSSAASQFITAPA